MNIFVQFDTLWCIAIPQSSLHQKALKSYAYLSNLLIRDEIEYLVKKLGGSLDEW